MSDKPSIRTTTRTDGGREWDLTIPPSLAPSPADAYEVPDDPESNHIGYYGVSYWPTWGEAIDALNQWIKETHRP